MLHCDKWEIIGVKHLHNNNFTIATVYIFTFVTPFHNYRHVFTFDVPFCTLTGYFFYIYDSFCICNCFHIQGS